MNTITATPTALRIATLLTAGTLAVAACGGSDSTSAVSLSGADQELAEALAEQWESEGQFPAALEIACVANAFISGVGGADGAARYDVNVNNIDENTFDAKPLEQGDALAAANAMYDCREFKSILVSDISDVTDPDDLQCLTDAITDEPLRALLASTFMGDAGAVLEEQYENDFEADLFDGLESCDISA